jgi:MerR family transcriptional regulator/heat shock protein HspR
MREYRTIQAAAEESQLSPSTLRAYERLGLVSPARDTAGRRLYSAADIANARKVARERAAARGIGFRGAK